MVTRLPIKGHLTYTGHVKCVDCGFEPYFSLLVDLTWGSLVPICVFRRVVSIWFLPILVVLCTFGNEMKFIHLSQNRIGN